MKNIYKKLLIAVLPLVALLVMTAPAHAAIQYSYDANGNMTSDQTNCYTYNDYNQISKVKNCSTNTLIAEYSYNYAGQRDVKKEYDGNGNLKWTIISFSDSYEVKKYPDGHTEKTNYIFANDQLIAKKNPDGSKQYFHNDHLGSTSLITDQSGSKVEETTYDPFGEVKSGGTTSKFQYTGQEKDQNTGLNYYNSRYYNSHIRRFTQPDDVIPNVYNPQSLNRYSYVLNNPLRYTDPTGHFSFSDITSFVSNVVNTVTSFVSNLFAKPAAPAKTNTSTTSTQSNSVKSSNSGSSTSTSSQNSQSILGSTASCAAPAYAPPNVNISTNMQQASQHPILGNIGNAFWFYNKVRTQGKWDYKQQGSQFEDYGNFHYGAVGQAAGYPEDVLLKLAGAYQVKTNIENAMSHQPLVPSEGIPFIVPPYGDDPKDQYWIDQGYHYASNFQKP